MFISIVDIFKIGVGPSSSHTMGPMVAAARFVDDLRGMVATAPGSARPGRVTVTLHGSLAFTGRGHATDRAVILGLCGFRPDTVDPDLVEPLEAEVRSTGRIDPEGLDTLRFDPARDLVFDGGPPLEGHANGLVLRAFDIAGDLFHSRTYYSVGGGFVLTEEELQHRSDDQALLCADGHSQDFPYPFRTAGEMLEMGRRSGETIARMKRANESIIHGEALDRKIERIRAAMDDCIERGLSKDGVLPGGLAVRRRARAIRDRLVAEIDRNRAQPHQPNDWLSVYAMAVNEENAAGGRVVTSPTNGAAGVVPAVLRYYREHCIGAHANGVTDFLLVAAAIGGLIKHNASISGAEVGCQGEVGSAAAMAAAGLCAALGGSNEQVENAAEIALEHHLGMTCDPAAGLVQVPCIERNALGAIKAVSAASLALHGDGQHFMPLDNCVRAMLETGRDMSSKYKETSIGGIAVNLPEC
ncbi:MAG: L-serine ammonia-lyase [Burkholderiaceae bacterium]|nr:L-serine ammonia-lyase [Burkholderiaceae bacterium]